MTHTGAGMVDDRLSFPPYWKDDGADMLEVGGTAIGVITAGRRA